MEPQEKLTTRRAVAKLTWVLAHGENLTTAEAALMTGLTRWGAKDMLDDMSGVIPIYQDEDSGLWQVVSLQEVIG